jgi:hypothetical protein
MKLLEKWTRRVLARQAAVTDEKLGFFLTNVTFSDGTEIQLAANSIVILTGPNNVGKSSALAEIATYLQDIKQIGPVLRSVKTRITGSEEAFGKFIKDRASYDPDFGGLRIGMRMYETAQIHEDYGKSFVGSRASPLLFSHLRADARLRLTQPKSRDQNSRVGPDSTAFRSMEIDEEAEQHLSDACEKAFGKKLALNRLGGEHLSLHIYEGPKPQFKSVFSREHAAWLASLKSLDDQGDGVRSFVGTIMALLVDPKSLVLLDEPEAFLHPPHAYRLAGELAASESQFNRCNPQ